jgi:two-component system NtrC family sensor kinase
MSFGLWRRLSIRIKIIAAVAGTLIIAQFVTALLIRGLVNEYIVAQKMSLADVLTTSILHDIKYTDRLNAAESSAGIVAKYMTYYRDITRMTIYDDSMAVVASSETGVVAPSRADREITDAIHRARPILHADHGTRGVIQIRSVAPILRGSRIVGALDLDVSIRDVSATLSAIDERIVLIMAVKLVAVGAVLFYLLRGAILRRLGRLMEVTKAIAAGNYDTRVDDAQHDEISALGHAFNTMASDLKRSKQEIEGHNRELKRRVDDATAEVMKTYHDLKSAQGQLVLNEKMASLGVLIAGIAHEINTPVGAILNVSRTLGRAVSRLPEGLDRLHREPAVPFEKIQACMVELVEAAARAGATGASHQEVRAVEQILSGAGVSDYRTLAATLAKFNFTTPQRVEHYVDCFSLPSFLAVAEPLATIAQAAKISESSSEKIAEIVRALKYYAYSDKDRVEPIQINQSIQTALVLLRNQLKHSVTVVTDYGADLPAIACSSDIHQVWTNLVSNAADAIAQRGNDGDGRVTIATRAVGNDLVVTVTDNGTGIRPEILGQIFDPFFTTKDIGKGTGLGLGIVAGIVKKHHGAVTVESVPGQTTFTVRLPRDGMPDVGGEPTASPANGDGTLRRRSTDRANEEAA